MGLEELQVEKIPPFWDKSACACRCCCLDRQKALAENRIVSCYRFEYIHGRSGMRGNPRLILIRPLSGLELM